MIKHHPLMRLAGVFEVLMGVAAVALAGIAIVAAVRGILALGWLPLFWWGCAAIVACFAAAWGCQEAAIRLTARSAPGNGGRS